MDPQRDAEPAVTGADHDPADGRPVQRQAQRGRCIWLDRDTRLIQRGVTPEPVKFGATAAASVTELDPVLVNCTAAWPAVCDRTEGKSGGVAQYGDTSGGACIQQAVPDRLCIHIVPPVVLRDGWIRRIDQGHGFGPA